MKKIKHQEYENTERWLLTYADLITLLLGVFVVLYSTAQQDTEKFREAVQAMVRVLNPSDVKKGGGNSKEFAITIGKDNSEKGEEEKCNDKNLENLKKEMETDKNLKDVSLRETKDGIIIDLKEKLLFDTGKTEFKKEAYEVLKNVAIHINKVHNNIKISGHTDNVPIHNAMFDSNWHLSLARAAKTAEYLINKEKVELKRVVTAAYADTMPVASNDTPEGREKNRRVEILILKDDENLNKSKGVEKDGEDNKETGH
jgi:chemotaxis protein MotB